jgi:sporulation protein YlmC with PRC-barrel domain
MSGDPGHLLPDPLRVSPERERRVELLLGRRVVDPDGASVGRIEDIIADFVGGGDECVVRAYLVGRHGLAERLGGGRLVRALVRLLGGGRGFEGCMVPWEAMDLSDPERPRCTVRRAELPSVR